MKMIFKHKEFSDAVFEKRMGDRASKMTLEVLGKKLNLSKATLSRIESENMPDILTYAKLCKWLGAPLEKFIK